MPIWVVCGRRRGLVVVLRRGLVVAGAGQCGLAAAPAVAAMSWMNRPGKPSGAVRRRMRGLPHMMVPFLRPGTGPVVPAGEGRSGRGGGLPGRVGVAR